MSVIVFEGIDGSGKATQVKLLKEYFEKKRIPIISLRSPQYETPVGKAIKDYLDEKLQMESDTAFLLYCVDNIMNAHQIKKARKEKKLVIVDRYITSTIVYQAARGFSFEKAVKFAKLMEFPKADMIIYIDITPETSIKRKQKEKGVLDLHEKNAEYLGKVREFYLEEVKRNILGKWLVIDGERSIKEIHEKILRIVKREIKLGKNK